MPIRRLLLPLTGTAAGEAALATALMVARMWNAHVTALHVRVDSRDVAPLAGEGLSGAMIEEMMSATEKESSDRSDAVRAMFDRFVAQHGVTVAEPHAAGGGDGELRVGDRARGGPGGAAGAAGRPDGGAASGGGRRREQQRRAACGAVRQRPAGADRAADGAGDDRDADLRRLERHGGERCGGAGGDPVDAAGARRCGSCMRTSTSGAGRGRPELAQLSGAARHPGRDRRCSGRRTRTSGAACWRRRGSSAPTCWRWAPTRTRGCAS